MLAPTAAGKQAKLVGNCVPTSAHVCAGPNGTGGNYRGVNTGEFGSSVALSADGNTALIGAVGDVSSDHRVDGAAWVFTRSGSGWSQQGSKLIGDCTGSCSGPNGTVELGGHGQFGAAVAFSTTASAAVIGAPNDN